MPLVPKTPFVAKSQVVKMPLIPKVANNPAQAEVAARMQVSDLLESLARDLTNAAEDYGMAGWRVAAILSEVDVPVASLTDHCAHTVAATSDIARELQRVAGEVRAADEVRDGSLN
jgi:hypothetical protein